MLRKSLALALVLVALPDVVRAQDGYQQPPEPMRAILDRAPVPSVALSPDRATILYLERTNLPSITEVASPQLGLAGTRIDPRTNGPAQSVVAYNTGFRLQPVSGGSIRDVRAPADGRYTGALWSPDSRHFVFVSTSDTALTLWVAEVATANARQLTNARLNGTMGVPCRWIDASRLACLTIPAGRGAAPEVPMTPTGPIVQEARGRAAPNRTYPDLLGSTTDERRFEHYFTSQVAIVSLDGSVRPIGNPGLHQTPNPSPDGRYLLMTTVHRPYSYVVPLFRFPKAIAVWDMNGRQVHEVADIALQENVPTSFDAVTTGPRAVTWRADAPATLTWVEALDGGNPATRAEKRDRIYLHDAPFTARAVALMDLDFRSEGVDFIRPDLAFVSEGWWRTRRTRTHAINPQNPAAPARVVWDRSSEDRYGDPGFFVTAMNRFGRWVPLLSADGRYGYLMGAGASSEGERPFLDRIELATGRTERLWRSAAPYYEGPVAVLDPAARRMITRRESPDEPPNYYIRSLPDGRVTAQLTRFADPAPELAGVKGELIRYRRADGVELSATLYLPPRYDRSRGPLPMLFWAYPEEFKSAQAAAQVSGSPYKFVRPGGSSHLLLLTQGYAILDNFAMPIVAADSNAEPNDRFVEQMVANARAAVDKVVEMGVGDRNRIGVAGHSYGAFMTANLLAHSDLFRAGIARSGAYNRTLTPFGFQSEERTYWQAGDTYNRMSPFTYANQINEPILLIHGMADNNSGTYPIQSERLFQAIKGLGGHVRYVQLPSESHGYRARESVGHVLFEMARWMDQHVRDARPATQAGAPTP